MIGRFIKKILSIIYLEAVWLTFVWWVNIYILYIHCHFHVDLALQSLASLWTTEGREVDNQTSSGVACPCLSVSPSYHLQGSASNKCWMKVLGIHIRCYKDLLTMFLFDNICLGLQNWSTWFVWGGLHLFSGSTTERRYCTSFQEKSKKRVVPSSKVWLND